MLKEEDKKRLQEISRRGIRCVSAVFKGTFNLFSVKRGLRNDDSTGVMAGLTSVGAVLGYYIDDGEKSYGRSFEIPWL